MKELTKNINSSPLALYSMMILADRMLLLIIQKNRTRMRSTLPYTVKIYWHSSEICILLHLEMSAWSDLRAQHYRKHRSSNGAGLTPKSSSFEPENFLCRTINEKDTRYCHAFNNFFFFGFLAHYNDSLNICVVVSAGMSYFTNKRSMRWENPTTFSI